MPDKNVCFRILAGVLLAACLPFVSVVAGEDDEKSYLSPPEVMKIAEESDRSYSISTLHELEELDVTDLASAFWPSMGGQLDYPWISTTEDGNLSLSQYALDEGCLALLEEAEPLFQKEKYDKAAELYARATREFPGCYVAVSHLGDCHQFRGEHEEAASLYRRAIELNPHDFLGHYYLGNALAKLGKFAQAREAYVQALARRPHRESVVKTVRALENELDIRFRDEPFQPRAFARPEGEGVGVYFDPEAGAYWLAWGLCKAVWIGEPQVREARVGDSEHAWTLTEERQCLLTMLESYFAQREAEGLEEDPEMERILRAMDDGLLDAFVMYEVAYRHFPHSTILLPERLFDDVVRYVDTHVAPLAEVPETPSAPSGD